MRVQKKGRIVDIPVRSGTVVKLRDSQGRVINKRAIVVGLAPHSDFSRAYGRQAYVCTFYKWDGKNTATVSTRGAGDLYPVGRTTRRIPKACREALRDFEEAYPSLARKKRSR